jgi:antitoxin ParD1/3/4
MTVKTSISLTDEQEAFARRLVEKGQFSSLSAVLQRGLDMLRQENELHEAELEALRALIDRRSKGTFTDLDTLKTDTLAMLERKRRERGL